MSAPLDDGERRRLVTALHDSPTMLVAAVAGGGNALITDLLDVGGASRTVLEIVVPYAPPSMAEFTGVMSVGRGVVSPEQAEAMAQAALDRATALAPAIDVPLVGLGITAALATDRVRRGHDRAHLCLATHGDVVHESVEFDRGALDRRGQDRVVADAALRLLVER